MAKSLTYLLIVLSLVGTRRLVVLRPFSRGLIFYPSQQEEQRPRSNPRSTCEQTREPQNSLSRFTFTRWQQTLSFLCSMFLLA